MSPAPVFSSFVSLRNKNGRENFCCSNKPQGVAETFIWAKSLCEQASENYSKSLELSSFYVKKQDVAHGKIDTLVFIAATKVETIEDRLNRLSRYFSGLKNAPEYLRQDNDSCIRGLAAEIKKTEEAANIGTTVFYTEPATEIVKPIGSDANTFFFNPDGTILLFPERKSPIGYKSLVKPSIYTLGRWPELKVG